ncbi:hypothetical protein QBC36DRAFT_355895 [Triangularia setosa]|uniref:RING-type domain-containing protein n=1 Tax=Triangularia setosa TaxID=2587417 RepID=A0AAN7A7B1_9PEZI|nr:hypothetical protein QBC36DRAFT_355895 [Podospora setosa]
MLWLLRQVLDWPPTTKVELPGNKWGAAQVLTAQCSHIISSRGGVSCSPSSAAAIMANNFFDSGFDELFGELASFTLPFPLPPPPPPPLPSPAASNSQHANQSGLGRPPLQLPGLPAFGAMCPLPSVSPSGFPPLPGASPWSSTQWQSRQPAQAGAHSGTAASFISGPTFSRGAPHPPMPMPSTAPASHPGLFLQPSTTIGSAQLAPANPPQPQRATVNNLSRPLSSSRPTDPFHNTLGTITPTPSAQQREPNSDDFYLNQFTGDLSSPSLEPNSDDFYFNQLSRDFSSPFLPSASATPQRSATRINNPGTNNPFSRTLHRILPPPASRTTPVAPPAGLRVPPPPWPRSTPTSKTNEESGDSDSADNMPTSSRQTRRRSGQQLTLPQAPRASGASSSSSAATASNQQQSNSSKSQSNQARIAQQAASRRASNASVSAAGSATKRKREEFEFDLDEDDLFADNDVEVIDLVEKDVPDLTPEEKEKVEDKKENWIKLSQFQCVICMDDVTDLTVTYCGHLFCSECLHSALQISPHKRICPICRQKIENKNASGKFGPKAKGYYPLEIKLMTKKSLGKRAAASRNTGE